MANPMLPSPRSAYSTASPFGAWQSRRLSVESMAPETEILRPSLITRNELEESKVRSQQDEFVYKIEDETGELLSLKSRRVAMTVEHAWTKVPWSCLLKLCDRTCPLQLRSRGRNPETTKSTTLTTAKTETESTTELTVFPDTSTTEPLVTTDTTERPTVFPPGFRGPLICTVSVHFTESSLLPEDGLCDIIFYESFYVKHSPSGWNDTGLDHFFELVSSMYDTRIGASFSTVSRKLFEDYDEGLLYGGIDNLLSKGVQHFGMLNLYGIHVYDTLYCLEILGNIGAHVRREFQDRWHQYPHRWPRVVYTVLGVLTSEHYGILNIQYVEAAFNPTHFIAITHVSDPDDVSKRCSIYPMSMLKSLNTYGLPSIVCSTEYGSYYRYNSKAAAEYSFDPHKNRTLVFDSEKGMKEKVCAALFLHSNLVFGLAAYDIDFDQEHESCPNLFIGRGSFRRVKILHFMSGYPPEPNSWMKNDTLEECNAQKYAVVGNPCCPGW
ncbi:hypothetical protein MTO96_048015 [Rhipicephalus appendiculatus]